MAMPRSGSAASGTDRGNSSSLHNGFSAMSGRDAGNGNMAVHTAGYRGLGNGNNNGAPNGTLGNARAGGANANIANHLPGEFNVAGRSFNQGNGHNCQSYSYSHLNQHCNQIRGNFYNGGFYNSGWYGNYFSPWWPGIWYGGFGGGLWGGMSYSGLSGFCGLNPVAYPYNYGTNVVYANDQVLVNGDSVGTPADYYQQAARIATNGNTANLGAQEEWQALGLFALSKSQESDATNFVQLAVNKDGLIRGNYYNSVLNTTLPVTGSIDKQTQRAAWTVGEKSEAVYEAGAKNLTQEQATCLVHFNDRRSEQLIMTRLKEPEKTPAAPNDK